MNLRTRSLRLALVPVLLLGLPLAAQARKGAVPKVDGSVIRSYIATMCQDDKEGRKSLTPGYEKTARWAADKFREWGVKPAGDKGTYFQDVPVTRGFTWATGVPSLVVDGRAFYVQDSDFTVDTTSTPNLTVNGEVVFVGYGISAAAKGLDEYAGLDVKGRIVVAFKGSPKDAPGSRGRFLPGTTTPADPEAWMAESEDQAKIATAYAKGAAAILLFDPAKLASAAPFGGAAAAAGPGGGGRRRAAPDSSPFTRPFLVVPDVNERVFRQVMYRDQTHESVRGFAARMDTWRRDIRDHRTHSMATGVKAQVRGYATTVYYSDRLKNNISHNVIGKVEGTDPKLKAQYIVIGGHLDHLGVTNGVVFPGADDDASGAATTMEMARLFAANAATLKPKRTIIFALWCGEELGLLGSNYYGDHPSDGVTMDAVVADFNNDMVGLGDHLGMPGALNFPTIFDVIMKNQDPEVARLVVPSTSGPGGSDYSTFIARGIEALALMTTGGTGHPDYHDAGDDLAKISTDILGRNGQFVFQGTYNLAVETGTNLLIPDRLHLYNGLRLMPLSLASAGAAPAGRGGGGQAPATGPRFSVALSSPAAFAGNPVLIDVTAKLLGVGRVEIPAPGDGTWFTATEVTERGRAAVKEFERSGVVLQLKSPSDPLVDSMVEAASKAFIIDGMSFLPDAALAKKLTEKNVLLTVEFDADAPQVVASRLLALRQALGGSSNLLLVQGPSPALPLDPAAVKATTRKVDEAKQAMYLTLIKAGWTRDEIYALVGVDPARPTGEMPAAPPTAPRSRFAGNLKKLG
jgi:hypothetical protein